MSRLRSAAVFRLAAVSALPALLAPVSLAAGGAAPDPRLVAVTATEPGEVATRDGGVLRVSAGTQLVLGDEPTVYGGNALLSSAGGFLRRKSESIQAGPAHVTCRGTALVAVVPGRSVKVACLEGTATVRLHGRRAAFLALEAGRMVLFEADAARIPDPVEVRLDRLARTTDLMAAPFHGLPSEKALAKAIARQNKEIDRGDLFTSFVEVTGSGGETTVEDGVGGDTDTASASTSDTTSGTGTSSTSSSTSSGGGSSSGGGGGASGGTSGGTGAVASAGGASSSSSLTSAAGAC